MKTLVRDLADKVSGAASAAAKTAARQEGAGADYADEELWPQQSRQTLAPPRKQSYKPSPQSHEALQPPPDNARTAGVRPEEIIPFDDEDLRDF